MARAKKQQCDALPTWLCTYGDLMSLLLTFFVLLVAFSTIDEKKISQALGSIQGALGVLQNSNSAIQPFQQMLQRQQRHRESLERVARELKNRLQVLGMDKGVDIKYNAKGDLEISLPSQVLFDFGRADLRAEAYEILNPLASLLADVPSKFVEVRGHTDNVPVGPDSPFADNYDLSYYRAKNVTRQLTQAGGVPEKECEVIACGPSQPVADNTTEEGRQSNRRVQIRVRGVFSDETEEAVRQISESLSGGIPTPVQPMEQ